MSIEQQFRAADQLGEEELAAAAQGPGNGVIEPWVALATLNNRKKQTERMAALGNPNPPSMLEQLVPQQPQMLGNQLMGQQVPQMMPQQGFANGGPVMDYAGGGPITYYADGGGHRTQGFVEPRSSTYDTRGNETSATRLWDLRYGATHTPEGAPLGGAAQDEISSIMGMTPPDSSGIIPADDQFPSVYGLGSPAVETGEEVEDLFPPAPDTGGMFAPPMSDIDRATQILPDYAFSPAQENVAGMVPPDASVPPRRPAPRQPIEIYGLGPRLERPTGMPQPGAMGVTPSLPMPPGTASEIYGAMGEQPLDTYGYMGMPAPSGAPTPVSRQQVPNLGYGNAPQIEPPNLGYGDFTVPPFGPGQLRARVAADAETEGGGFSALLGGPIREFAQTKTGEFLLPPIPEEQPSWGQAVGIAAKDLGDAYNEVMDFGVDPTRELAAKGYNFWQDVKSGFTGEEPGPYYEYVGRERESWMPDSVEPIDINDVEGDALRPMLDPDRDRTIDRPEETPGPSDGPSAGERGMAAADRKGASGGGTGGGTAGTAEGDLAVGAAEMDRINDESYGYYSDVKQAVDELKATRDKNRRDAIAAARIALGGTMMDKGFGAGLQSYGQALERAMDRNIGADVNVVEAEAQLAGSLLAQDQAERAMRLREALAALKRSPNGQNILGGFAKWRTDVAGRDAYDKATELYGADDTTSVQSYLLAEYMRTYAPTGGAFQTVSEEDVPEEERGWISGLFGD